MTDNDKSPMPDDVAKGLPPEFGSDEYKETLTKDEKIKARQQQIAQIKEMYPSITNSQLAKELKVSESTVSRDIEEIQESAWVWSNGLAKNGFVFNCQQAVQKIDRLISKLEKTLNSADAHDQASLAKAINDLQMSKIQITGKATFEILKVARSKYIRTLTKDASGSS